MFVEVKFKRKNLLQCMVVIAGLQLHVPLQLKL
jgi:hypothetical protein